MLVMYSGLGYVVPSPSARSSWGLYQFQTSLE